MGKVQKFYDLLRLFRICKIIYENSICSPAEYAIWLLEKCLAAVFIPQILTHSLTHPPLPQFEQSLNLALRHWRTRTHIKLIFTFEMLP